MIYKNAFVFVARYNLQTTVILIYVLLIDNNIDKVILFYHFYFTKNSCIGTRKNNTLFSDLKIILPRILNIIQ